MLQILPKEESLTPTVSGVQNTIEFINKYIDKFHCEHLSVDISFLNVLDACYVSTICAAKHYVKYPQGKICWKIASELSAELNKKLDMGNSDYTIL